MTQLTLGDYALLSNAMYAPQQAPAGWRFLEEAAICHGAAFQKENHVVVAFRGTADMWDLEADISILLNHENAIFPSAFAFYAQIKHRLANTIDVTLTGHSLGGAMAAFCAFYARYTHFCSSAQAYVFNALPIATLIAQHFPDATMPMDFVHNIDDQYDVVSHLLGKHQLGACTVLSEHAPHLWGWTHPFFYHSMQHMTESITHL